MWAARSISIPLCALMMGGGLPAIAQTVDRQETPYAEEEQVIAVDVLIDPETGKEGPTGAPELRRGLGPENFEVRVAGESQPVVGFLDPRGDTGTARVEPWTLVLYFDLGSSAVRSIRWAATILAEAAAELTALGAVEIVIADPWPLRHLAPTRDEALLAETLSGLALEGLGGHAILERRTQLLEALPVEADQSMAELATRLAEEETALVTRRLDGLLTALADRSTAAPRKAVFLIDDGFDLEPERFYRSALRVTPTGEARPALSLAERTRRVSEALAGYGWLVVALVAPERSPGLVPGFRIGKWRVASWVPPPGTGIGRTLTREHEREPETAEGFFELGQARLDAGEAEAAAESFERALYHFAGDPRTAERQAAAKAGLGRALSALGREEEAREAFADAVALDESWAEKYPGGRASLDSPLEPVETLARETAGRITRDGESLKEAIGELGRRLRLTYQVEGWPRGANLPLDVALKGSDLPLRLPGWMRSGTPEEVAAARARRVLAGDLLEGDLVMWLDLVAETAEERRTGVIVELDLTSREATWRDDRPHAFRLTVGAGGPGEQTVLHHRVDATIDPLDSTWSRSVPVGDLSDEDWIVVILEDLESGLWGVGLIESAGHQATP